jgi:dUTP pyrophosphatase
MFLKTQKTHLDAVLPVYGSAGAGCFDLIAVEVNGGKDAVNVLSGAPVLCNIGLAFEIPVGHVMLIFSRSGHGFKNAVRLSNCVGVIDSDYRGTVQVKLTMDASAEYRPMQIKPGDRVAQAIVVTSPYVHFELAEQLGETERGDGGFGSTGA